MFVSTVFAVIATTSAFSTAAMANSESAAGTLERRTEMHRKELLFLSASNPFPVTPIAPIDPITKQKKDRVLIGPAFRVPGNGDFDYYRYVTFYDVTKRKERAHEYPEQEQDCHDEGAMFANFGESTTFTALVNASVSIQGIGLSSTFTKARTPHVVRNITAIKGVRAIHTPYYIKQDWEGRTFIQTFNSKTGKTGFLTQPRERSSWFVQTFFPILAETGYPMEFSIQDADWGIRVEVTIVSRCNNGSGK